MNVVFASWNCKDKNDYAYQNWYSPLSKIAKNLIVFDPREIYFKYGKEELNTRLLNLVKQEKPDVLFMTLIYDEFYLDTLKKIKEISPKTKTINFFSDDEWRFDNYSKYLHQYFDVCVTTYLPAYAKAKKLGLNNFVFIPYCCNTEIYHKKKTGKEYGVSFVGQPTKERIREIEKLIESGLEVHIWGRGWDRLDNFSTFKKNYHGIAQDFPEIINKTKIMLTFLKDNADEKVQIKGRLTEVGGCGTFQIVTDNEHTKKMARQGVHVDYFRSSSDLIKKIKYYLKNERTREKIAERFRKEVIAKYNWDKSISKIVNYKLKRSDSNFTRSLTRVVDLTGNPDIGSVVRNSEEKYFIFSRTGLEIDMDLSNMLAIADRDKPDLVLVDTMLMKRGKEIVCARYQDFNKGNKRKMAAFSGSAIFSKDYAMNNLDKLGEIFGKMSNRLDVKDSKFSVIAYPMIKVLRMPLAGLEGVTVDRKFEISAFNLIFNNRYLAAMKESLSVFFTLVRDGNLFILKSADGRRLPY